MKRGDPHSRALDLSVILPFGGIGDASLSLASLEAQNLPRERYEILFVYEPPLPPPVARIARTLRVRLLPWLRPPAYSGHSAGRMRNAGAAIARSPRLLFVDADCLLGPETLAIHAEVDSGRAAVLCGGIRELPATFPASSIPRLTYHQLCGHAKQDYRLQRNPSPRRAGHWLELYSGNFSISSALFHRVGGFDEQGFRCHDADLSYRLSKCRARFVYDADAGALHIEHPRVAAYRLEQAGGWQHLAHRYPELRDVAQARIAKARELWSASVADASDKFAQITVALPGRQLGTMWLLPPGFSQQDLQERLGPLPQHVREVPGATEHYLRLNRDCWDFSIVRPQRTSPAITVVIPVFNGLATIERALSSVLAQTRQDFEIIVVDDASRDGTPDVVAQFSDERLHLVTLERNRGMCPALNVALDLATAPVLLQLDADDWLEPNALAVMCGLFARDPKCGAAYCDAIIHQADDKVVVGRGTPATSKREILACRFRQVARTYRRSLLEQVGGWPTEDPFGGRGYYEDRLMLARISQISEVRYVRKALYHSAESPHSLSRQPSAAMMKYIVLQREAMHEGMSVATKPGSRALTCRWIPRRMAATVPWSIVIPCHGRPQLLRLSLLTWLAADLANGSEILVVDDGSGEPLQRLVNLQDRRLRFLRLDTRRGAAAARNRGAAQARNAWLFFSDGDHLVPPDVLQVHSWYHQSTANALVMGGAFGAQTVTTVAGGGLTREAQKRLLALLAYSPQFHETASTLALRYPLDLTAGAQEGGSVWRQAWRTAFYWPWMAPWAKPMLDGTFDLTDVPHAWLRLGAGNLSVRRSAWEALGGFDSELEVFEDWDLAARWVERGGRILVNSDAEPLHQVHARDPFRPESSWRSARRFARKHSSLIAALRSTPRRELPPGGEHLLQLLAQPRFQESARESDETACVSCLALTFDDGPHSVGTPLVLDILRHYGGTATFFVTGSEVARCPEVTRRIFTEGHEIGIHGWSHEPPSSMDFAALCEAMRRTLGAVGAQVPFRPRWVRAPYGEFTPAFRKAAQAVGLECAGWNVSGRDWLAHHSKVVIQNLAVEGIAGRVLVLHDGCASHDVLTETLHWIGRTCRQGKLALSGLSTFARFHGVPSSDMSTANAF